MFTVIIYYDHLIGIYDENHNPLENLKKLLKENDIYDQIFHENIDNAKSLEDLISVISHYNIPMHIYKGNPNIPQSNWRLE